MAFELKQNLKLAQQLIMTPQLQQAIKLLQLSRMELAETINQEMEENPLLEEVASDEEPEAEKTIEPEPVEEGAAEEGRILDRTEELTGSGDGREEFDWDSYMEDYGPVGTAYDRREATAPSWDNLLVGKTSLTDYLMWQLLLAPLNDQERRIGEQIIGNLDQNGYLVATLEEIAQQEGVVTDRVGEMLAKVQEFDPNGIAARDLQECLLLQARFLGQGRSLVERIIAEHMKDLEIKNYSHIARKLKAPLEDVLAAVVVITNMDPKPGSVYNEERIQAIVPDVYVIRSGDDYKIVLNEEGLPRLRISNFYREIIGGSGGLRDENGKRYIKERVQSATWLIKSIQQRQKTIYRVAESIVRHQRDFFDRGVSYLKPLILRDIAEDVQMHESTISRVVTNKYLHSARGIFEMKYFFGSSIRRTGGDEVASKSVQEEIRKIVGAEDPHKPLSDQEIVERLQASSGIAIARRTVAKYREMMGILPSSRRKKYF
jgi:RNA polymerase sigma-54 factor